MITRSESIGELMKALDVCQLAIGAIEKDAFNPAFKSKYATLAAILEAIDAPKREAGIVLSQWPTGDGAVVTRLHHLESGEWQESEFRLQPSKNDPQGVVGAITYAKRCALTGIFNLRLDNDDDGNAASDRKAVKADKSAKARAKSDKAMDTKPYKELLAEIQGLKEQLTDVEPAPGEAGRFYSRQKAALGLMSADDLANNTDAGREMAKNMAHQLEAWKLLAATADPMELGPDDIPHLTLEDFGATDRPLIIAWVKAAKKKPLDVFFKGWEGSREDALEAARDWKGL